MALSASQLSLEGFRLIARRPVSVLVWALIWIVLGYGVLGLLLAGRLPEIIQTAQGLETAARTDPMSSIQAILRFELDVGALVAPWLLWVWILATVLHAAMFRALLEPARSGWAYLRVGGDELRLFLLQLILDLLWLLFLAALVGAGAALVLGARSLERPWQILADCLGVVVLVGIAIYTPIRLALAAPMTFADKRLRIFDSWSLTGRSALKILGIALLAFVFAAAIAMLAGAVRSAIFYGAIGSISSLGAGEGLVDATPAQFWRLAGPLFLGFVIFQGLMDTLIRLIAAAPFAAAYRALKEPAAVEA